MCGFAGVVNFSGLSDDLVRRKLARSEERLRPRGPDSSDIWIDNYCAIINTRLAVQDLGSSANLPMVRDNYVIAFNGEIYNFKELRSQLEKEGHRFSTGGDTEVLLIGWKVWGEALLDKLCGMFAFAIWDKVSESIFLARDRFGKKPLLFHRKGNTLTFASDLIALESLLDYTPEIDLDSLYLYLSFRWLPDPKSIVKNVEKIPAGGLAKFNSNEFICSKWYHLNAQSKNIEINSTSLSKDLVNTFDQAVKDRMISDVPIGVFLSGGIDSALVAASMRRNSNNVQSFTLGFEGASDYYEERPAARKVSRAIGTSHTDFSFSYKDIEREMSNIFSSFDEPFADSSALPTFLLSREARKHVTVALTGDGADEIFGGYRKYQGELYANNYQKIPKVIRNLIIEPLVSSLPESKSGKFSEKFRLLRRFISHAGKDPIGRHLGWLQTINATELSQLFINKSFSEFPNTRQLICDYRQESMTDDQINSMLYTDTVLGLVSDMLVKVDRTTMAASLEARSPFLDHRLVALASSIPGDRKVRQGAGKWIIRHAFSERLPSDVFNLPKKGFEMPIAEWLTGPLSGITRRAIDPTRLKKQGLFDHSLPSKWYKDLENRKLDTAEKLWTLVAFYAWCENFRPNLVE